MMRNYYIRILAAFIFSYVIVCTSYAQENPSSQIISDSVSQKIKNHEMMEAELILLLNESSFQSETDKFNYSILYSMIAQYNYETAPSEDNWHLLENNLTKVIDYYFSHLDTCEIENHSYWSAAVTLSRYYLLRNDYALTRLYFKAQEAYEKSKREYSYPAICQILKDTYRLYLAYNDPGPTMLVSRILKNILVENNGETLEIAEAYKMMGDAHFKTSLSKTGIDLELRNMALEYYEMSKMQFSSIDNFDTLTEYSDLLKKIRIAQGESNEAQDSLEIHLETIKNAFSATERDLANAISFLSRTRPMHYEEYAKAVLVLGDRYKSKGETSKYELLLLQGVLDMKGGNQSLLGLIQERLSSLYYGINNYTLGELYADKAMKSLGSYDNGTIFYAEALCIRNKCRFHQGFGYDPVSVKELENECQNLSDSQQHTPMALSIMNHLQEMLSEIGDTLAANSLLDKIYKETSQDDRFRKLHQETTYKKALNHFKKKEYTTSVELMSRVIELEADPVFFETMYYLYAKSIVLSRDSHATEILERWISKSQENITTSFSCMGVTGRDILWGYKSRQLLELSLLNAYLQPSAASLKSALRNVIYTKGLKLKSQRELSDFIHNVKDETLIETHAELNELTDSLVYIEDSASAAAISSKIDILYNRLMFHLESNKNVSRRYKNEHLDVLTSLDKKEAAIEFIFLPTGEGYYYGALVQRYDSDVPVLIKLADCDSLKELLQSNNPNQLYRSTRLYEQVWEALEDTLKGIKTIFYATTGHLNFVNLDAVNNGQEVLCERYRMIRLTSTGDIEKYKQSNKKIFSDAALYYGIDYGDASESSPKNRSSLGRLVSSFEEGENINNILTSNGISVTLFPDTMGTERSFKEFSEQSPSILHITSHGYYLQSYRSKMSHGLKITGDDIFNDKPMSCSGILFSGANAAWCESSHKSSNDGMLSALELSGLDLSSTKLAVLSACETALGDLNEVEGTMGLIRGLKMAGVQTIVLSPWEVSDDKTSEWMSLFYQNVFRYDDIHDAYTATLLQMRNKGWSARHWAGFVIID